MSIATEISRLQTAKSNLKTSIENKGVDVPADTKLDGYSALVDAIQTGGGSASNLVHGTFTVGSTAGVTSIEIPYTGSGHPVMAVVVVAGGVCNPAYSHWYDTVYRYAVGQWTMTKSVMSSTPTYTTSGKENEGVTFAIYKNSTSSSTDYARYMEMHTNVFTPNNPNVYAAVNCVRFKGNTTLSYLVAAKNYGLLADTDYEYCIVYSE